MEDTATKITMFEIYWFVADRDCIRKYTRMQGRPQLIIKPQITRKLQIMFVIDIRPSYFHSRPIVDLAPSM